MYLVCAREFELVHHSSVFFDYFEGPYSFVVEFFAGSVRSEVLSVEPYFMLRLTVRSNVKPKCGNKSS